MAFVPIRRDQAAAVYANDLVRAVQSMNQEYAAIKVTVDRMAEMTTGQIEELYGIPVGFGDAVQAQLVAALGVLEADGGPMERLRTQLG